jgi:hypothetical protein
MKGERDRKRKGVFALTLPWVGQPFQLPIPETHNSNLELFRTWFASLPEGILLIDNPVDPGSSGKDPPSIVFLIFF